MSQITFTGNTVKVTVHARRDSSFRRLYAVAVKEFMAWQRTTTARNLRYKAVRATGRESAPDPINPSMFYHTQVFVLEGLPADLSPAQVKPATAKKNQYWIGIHKETGNRFEIIDPETPARGGKYPEFCAVIGPFRTRRGAAYMRDFGTNNPHLQSADDADRLASEENYSGYAWNPISR